MDDELDKILTLIEEWGELIVSDALYSAKVGEIVTNEQSAKWNEISKALNQMGARMEAMAAQLNE